MLVDQNEQKSNYVDEDNEYLVGFLQPDNVEIEAKIIKIVCYQSTELRNILNNIACILTFGLYYLFLRWNENERIFLCYRKCNIRQANYIRIFCDDGTSDFVELQNKEVFDDGKLYKYMEFRMFNFYFCDIQNCFITILFDFNDKTNDQIHEEYRKGIQLNQINKIRSIYGQNQIIIPEKTTFELLVDEILNPIYMFQILSFIIWYNEQYYTYTYLLMSISVVSIIFSLYEAKYNFERLREISLISKKVTVFRRLDNQDKFQSLEQEIMSNELVPGDLIKIQDNEIFPCDLILLNGMCVVNEAQLTGESLPVIKNALPNNSQKFDVQLNKSSLLYAGTLCLESKNQFDKDQCVVALVNQVGYNTMKGSLIRSIIFTNQNNFEFYQDAMRFIGVMFMVAILGFSFSVYELLKQNQKLSNIVQQSLDIITVLHIFYQKIAVPPALVTCMNIGIQFALERLKKKKIFCISPLKVNIAGKIQTMCFDKTGTLTEEGLDLYAVQALNLQKNFSTLVDKDNVTNLNISKSSNNQEDKLSEHNHEHLFQILSSCHSLALYKNNIIGDPMDILMFESTKTTFKESQDPDFKENVKAVIHLQFQNNLLKIGIVHRFEFESSEQMMSVVVKNFNEPFYRLHAKGSPEKIKSICLKNSIPDDFDQKLYEFAKEGYRVIGFASKIIKQFNQSMYVERKSLENDLAFVGFMILKNKLKPMTKPTLQFLNNANIRSIMVTGDNPLTAINIAKECGIINNQKTTYFGDLMFEDLNKSDQQIKWVIDDTQEQNNVDSKISINHYDLQNLQDLSQINHQGESQNYQLAMTGKAFSWMLSQNYQKDQLSKIIQKCQVFARMKPNEKASLIKLIQQNQNQIVGMCGDGANDCGALKAADVGISLSDAEASIAAPFTSKNQDISCVVKLLREGRCSLSTCFQCFKFMILYSMIQFINVTLLTIDETDLSNNQFLCQDLVIVFPLALLMANTRSPKLLGKHQPQSKLMCPQVIISVFGQSFIMLFFQLWIFFLIQTESWNIPCNKSKDNTPCDLKTALSNIANFQNIFIILAYSIGQTFRAPMYTNKSLFFYFIACFLISTYAFLYFDHFKSNILQYSHLPDSFKITQIFIMILNAIVTLVFEHIVNKIYQI